MIKKRRRDVKEIEPLLARVKEHLVKTYGEKLEAVILYGSFAKNMATEDSDIDIAIVLKGEVDPFKEREQVGDFVYDLALDNDELICLLPVSLDTIKDSIWPLYKSLLREGVRL